MTDNAINAPWWRCLHCGCDEYEDHVFTGHLKGVPMIHCANCKILHSVPDPDSKRALRWQISELAEALDEIVRVTHDRRDFTSRRVNSIAMSALSASAIEARRAATPQSGVVHESAVAESETPNG